MGTNASKWLHALSECLAAAEREQIGSSCPVVDHEVMLSTAGDADDMAVWLVCRTKEEKRQFADTEQARFVSAVKKKMLAAGFPESAVTSLTTRVTSRPELEASGGRFSALR